MARPRFRLPIWGAVAALVAAYILRSAMRGFDFAPDLPQDGLLLILVVIVIAAVGWVRADDIRRDRREESRDQNPTDPEA